MPTTPHIEKHFTASETVRDVVIGMSDGLTVPFALAAGISGAIAVSHVVVTAGLAEIAAGSISMGLGGYLAARSDADHYQHERQREEWEIREKTEVEIQEVEEILNSYGLSRDQSKTVAAALSEKPKEWIDFMMRFELGLEEPDPKRALTSALTIAAAYIVGGLVPLAPYMLIASIHSALTVSVIATLLALAIFGYIKGAFTGARPLRSAIQTVLIGGIAAGVAFLIARAIA